MVKAVVVRFIQAPTAAPDAEHPYWRGAWLKEGQATPTMRASARAISVPQKMDGRWNLFASFKSDPGITGIIVAKAVTEPPVRKYCMVEAPPPAAITAARGSAPASTTTWKNGTTTVAEAP